MEKNRTILITAGATYMDIDAYACSVALAELLQLQNIRAVAYSTAPRNYSVCKSLIEERQISSSMPNDIPKEDLEFIIVDVSDPEYLKGSAPLEQIVEIYDHHAGFEDYWTSRIGERAHIEFIGAAATMIYREWKKAGLQNKIKISTARLLVAAILDNTLNLTSQNTTDEDIVAFQELCALANVDENWCASYFAEVQENVEADLKNALFHDLKNLEQNDVLPSHVSQICLWDAQRVLYRMTEIRSWFNSKWDNWMINIIDLKHRCSYFACDDVKYQKEIEKIFNVHFDDGVAKSEISYLRKEIIKKAHYSK